MIFDGMRTRILAAVGAWTLGAVAATGGSLLAVSRLGQGLAGPDQQQLTSAAVNRALASEAREPAAPGPVNGTGSSAAPQQSSSPSPTAEPLPTGGALLSSAGGTVVAACAGAGAYLVSWSPQQGYEVAAVARGPATTATVQFRSGNQTVTMVVSCADGIASAATYARHSGDD